MSRSYEINIEVEDLDGDEIEKVKAAIDAIDSLDIDTYGSTVFAYGDTSLGGGMTTDERSFEIAEAVWQEVKRAVPITVNWWYKDRDPDETCHFDEEDYLATLPPLTQLAHADNGEED